MVATETTPTKCPPLAQPLAARAVARAALDVAAPRYTGLRAAWSERLRRDPALEAGLAAALSRLVAGERVTVGRTAYQIRGSRLARWVTPGYYSHHAGYWREECDADPGIVAAHLAAGGGWHRWYAHLRPALDSMLARGILTIDQAWAWGLAP